MDGVINSKNSTLVDVKDAYLQRTVGMDYSSAVDLVIKYGNDPESLLAKYEGKELETYKEKRKKNLWKLLLN